MSVIAQVGFFTTGLEAGATAIGAGVIVGGFLAAAVGMLVGRSRKEMEDNARKDVFLGGLIGALCLSMDLLTKLARLS